MVVGRNWLKKGDGPCDAAMRFWHIRRQTGNQAMIGTTKHLKHYTVARRVPSSHQFPLHGILSWRGSQCNWMQVGPFHYLPFFWSDSNIISCSTTPTPSVPNVRMEEKGTRSFASQQVGLRQSKDYDDEHEMANVCVFDGRNLSWIARTCLGYVGPLASR